MKTCSLSLHVWYDVPFSLDVSTEQEQTTSTSTQNGQTWCIGTARRNAQKQPDLMHRNSQSDAHKQPDMTRHSSLVCALSPVNHKGLHQGWTQTSFYLQLSHFTSHYTTKSWFFSPFIFRGHSTREPTSNRVTYSIVRAYTGTDVSHSQHRENSGEVLEKMQVNGPEV